MNVGVISYANASGHGNLIYSLKEMLPEMSQMIIPNRIKDVTLCYKSHENDYRATQNILPLESPRVYSMPPIAELEAWLDMADLDAVLLIEFPFNWDFMPELKRRGIKIMMMPLFDCYPLYAYQHVELIDGWIAPTGVAYRYLKQQFDNVYRLAVPINTEQYAFKERGHNTGKFLHNGGYLGVGGRKSTGLVCKAFKELKVTMPGIKLTVNMQVPFGCADDEDIEYNICNVSHPESLYEEGDVFVYPSTAEGIGLQILEAMSCGFPVITTNHPPMNEYISNPDLLVACAPPPADQALHGRPRLDFESLKWCMQFAATHDLRAESRRNRYYVEHFCSYDMLQPQYRKVFTEIEEAK